MTTIIIPGRPMPKPRGQRSDKWKSPPRPCIVKYREFKDRVKLATTGKTWKIVETGEIQRITVYFPFPGSWSKKRRASMQGKPHRGGTNDLDNVLKGLCDTLFENDGFIWRIGQMEKRWEDEQGPRIELVV